MRYKIRNSIFIPIRRNMVISKAPKFPLARPRLALIPIKNMCSFLSFKVILSQPRSNIMAQDEPNKIRTVDAKCTLWKSTLSPF